MGELIWHDHFLPNGYAILDGRVLHDDQWDGYPAERDRLAGWMADRGRAGGRTVLLSGDVHSSWAFTGPNEPGADAPVAVEVTTPATSSAAMGRAHYPGVWRVLDRAANRLPHVEWADVTERGYCALEVTPAAVTATWWFVHPYDQDPSARALPAASFRTERDRWPPRFERCEPDLVEPDRPDLPAPLPSRPDDLPRLRARRRARLAGELLVPAGGVLAAAALALRRRRRS